MEIMENNLSRNKKISHIGTKISAEPNKLSQHYVLCFVFFVCFFKKKAVYPKITNNDKLS